MNDLAADTEALAKAGGGAAATAAIPGAIARRLNECVGRRIEARGEIRRQAAAM